MRNNLIAFRKKVGFTQTDAASMFHVTKGTWCNIERGRGKGTAEMWISLGTRFNLTLEELKNLMEVS